MNTAQSIILRVGSTDFATTLQTLMKAPESSILRTTPAQDAAGIKILFLDRDATNFRYVLNYLRDGDVTLPSDVTVLQEVAREAEYYKLPGLVDKTQRALAAVSAVSAVSVPLPVSTLTKRRVRSGEDTTAHTAHTAQHSDIEDTPAHALSPSRCLFTPCQCTSTRGARCVCADILAGMSPVLVSVPAQEETKHAHKTDTNSDSLAQTNGHAHAHAYARTGTDLDTRTGTDTDSDDTEAVLVPSTMRFKPRKQTQTQPSRPDVYADKLARATVAPVVLTSPLSSPLSATPTPTPTPATQTPATSPLSAPPVVSPTAAAAPIKPETKTQTETKAPETSAAPSTAGAAGAGAGTGTDRVFDWCEIATHNTRSSCWLVVKGSVYDVTQFLPQHPAGANAILRHGGTDASEDFAFHSRKAHAMWKKLKIGRVKGAPCESRCVIM